MIQILTQTINTGKHWIKVTELMHFQRNVLTFSFYVAALVSITFGSTPTVTSGSVWEKFLPPEYSSLIHSSRDFSSNKKRFSARCEDYVLIEDGKMVYFIMFDYLTIIDFLLIKLSIFGNA